MVVYAKEFQTKEKQKITEKQKQLTATDTRVQSCLWEEWRGRACFNWKTSQKCRVSQDFCRLLLL